MEGMTCYRGQIKVKLQIEFNDGVFRTARPDRRLQTRLLQGDIFLSYPLSGAKDQATRRQALEPLPAGSSRGPNDRIHAAHNTPEQTTHALYQAQPAIYV